MDIPRFRLLAAAVHAAPVYMDKAATTAKVVKIIEDAGEQGIKLLAFPETFIPGYPYFIEAYPPLTQVHALAEYARQSVVCDGSDPSLRAVQDACRRARVTVSLGVSERVAGGHTLFNSQVHISGDGGTLLGVHRKLQPTYAERYVWAQGDGSTLRAWAVPHVAHATGPGGDTDGGGGGGGGGGGSEGLSSSASTATSSSFNLGGLCCWENTMNGARQALIEQGQHVHAAAWPALSTMRGFEAVADAQIEALAKAHALTAQAFVLCASSYVDDACLGWMERHLGPQDFVRRGGGWSAVVHPFCSFLAGPHVGGEEKLVVAELDFESLGPVKVWIDGNGHYKRPEVLKMTVDQTSFWPAPVAGAVVDRTMDGEPERREEDIPRREV